MAGKINAAELSPELRAKLRKAGTLPRRTAKRSMTMHQVRTHALRVLALVAELTPAERSRVLRQAVKVNDV